MQRIDQRRRASVAAAMLTVALALAATEGIAQSDKQPNLFKGAIQNREDPVKISAASLEVRDKQKKATFSGNVHVVQGDVELHCNVLVVHYESEMGKGGPKVQAAGAGNQQIRRMEAVGSVEVIQKEQRAKGDRAEFDMHKKTVMLTGNVVVSRGDDVLRGHALFVDLASGVSRMDSGGGRVEGIIKTTPGQQQPKPGRPN
jgi:lipopolysaccharide export system protein LptA